MAERINSKRHRIEVSMVLKNTRLLAWTGLALALLVGLWYVRASIEQALRTVVSLRQEISLTRRTLDMFAGLKTQKQRADAYKARLNTLFPTKGELLRVLAFLEDRASLHRLQQFFTFGAEVPATAQEPDHVDFNLSLTGGLQDFVDYLVEVEQGQSLVSFAGFEIINRSKGVYQINTIGKMYVQSHATSTK